MTEENPGGSAGALPGGKIAVVDRETAELEFERFVDAMELHYKMDPSKLDEEETKNLAECRGKLVYAIQRGVMHVNDSGELVYTQSVQKNDEDKEPLTFHEPDGATLMAMDAAKSGHHSKKAIKALAAITRTHEARFSRMKARDFDVCQAVLILFLG